MITKKAEHDESSCGYAHLVLCFAFTQYKISIEINELTVLIRDQRALIIGPIRQEILSGYNDLQKYKNLKEKLFYFDNTAIIDDDYELTAIFSNKCRIDT